MNEADLLAAYGLTSPVTSGETLIRLAREARQAAQDSPPPGYHACLDCPTLIPDTQPQVLCQFDWNRRRGVTDPAR